MLLFKNAKWLLLSLFILSLSLSMISLHYSEAIENDGLVLCEALDLNSTSCQKTHTEDNDNDHETIYAHLDFDLFKALNLFLPYLNCLNIPLPEYKNTYLFAFLNQLIKPPISIS